jgi:hypothetical protein
MPLNKHFKFAQQIPALTELKRDPLFEIDKRKTKATACQFLKRQYHIEKKYPHFSDPTEVHSAAKQQTN